jgi:hypothetical protein
VIGVLGAVPTVLGALVFIGAAASSDPNAGWAIFIILPLLALGIPILLTGLVLLFLGKTRARRGVIYDAFLHDGGGAGGGAHASENIVVPILGIVFSWFSLIGLPLSLYAYFGNPAGTRSRRLGLAGVFLSLGFVVLAVLR